MERATGVVEQEIPLGKAFCILVGLESENGEADLKGIGRVTLVDGYCKRIINGGRTAVMEFAWVQERRK